jgi:outer membrane protein
MKQLLSFLRCSFILKRDLLRIGATVLALPCLFQPAMAQQFQPKARDLVVRAGITALHFDSSASLAVAGTQLPGAGIHTSNNFTGSLEFDYYLLPNISMSLTVGIPPVTHVDGSGVLAPVGRLGDVRYGLGALLIKYHFNEWGRFQPYAGAGLAYFKVLNASGLGISNLKINDSLGPGLQAGFDYMLSQRIGLFASLSHVFLDTQGTGTFTGLPVTADVKLDPTVFQGGIAVRF